MTDRDASIQRVRIAVRGAVQGVGFRPFVYGLATRLGLAGYVLNEPRGVEIELEGSGAVIEEFLRELRESPPPLARIQSVEQQDIPCTGDTTFTILESDPLGERTVLIAPDIATCGDCLRELNDPDDRRYRYPFINCTNCGPRYTIIRALPYDRAQTTMAAFAMCDACRAEHEDPTNRRFHAEPTCCPVCGPRVALVDSSGKRMEGDTAIAEALTRLETGEILAVKGLGGFHLACDAANPEAVRRLRARKHRDLKPFAIMVRDLKAAERICVVPELERALLTGAERPIVLLEKRQDHGLADEVAPRSATFGVMLPYTPLHHLLMKGSYRALVMTSGNISDEPIAHKNEDARNRLAELADAFLLHNRDIHIRTDDSVVRTIAGQPRFLRRSRGYAPFPVRLPVEAEKPILAVGPELNNTVCLARGEHAFLSHHIGDLENVPAYESFLQAIEHLKDVFDVEPEVVACDLHPGYLSTRYAHECGLPRVPVQHHHAHVASVLAETGRTDRVIGVSFDGLGWGDDDGLWGGEFMVCDLAGFERAGHLEPIQQPGGDAAAKRPPRMAYAYLRRAFGEEADDLARELMPDFPEAERRAVAQLLERNVNAPLTSSVGRLFDAASALLGICQENRFHAQAPMELEAAAAQASDEEGAYPFAIEPANDGAAICRTDGIVRGLVQDRRDNVPTTVPAARFHNTLAALVLDICAQIRNNTGLGTVAVSGGVFANAVLLQKLVRLLEKAGFEVLLNAEVPAGDGGVSLGQAAVAAARLQQT